MSDLQDHQFEILPNEDAEDGVVFGYGSLVDLDENGFHPPEDAWIVGDTDNARHGGTYFGRDVLGSGTWGWDLFINAENTRTALNALRPFKQAWRASKIRRTPGAVIPVRMMLDGEVRRVYGRPRRWADTPTNQILGGYIPITVDFKAVDGYVYSDVEESVVFSMAGGSEGGFDFPLTFPFTTLPVGQSTQQIVVGGDEPAYGIYRFEGPVTNPSLETDGFSVELNLTVETGDWVEIDTRPWHRGIFNQTGGSPEGALTPGVFINDLVLEPGPHILTFRGNTIEGGSPTCTVRWRNTHDSY